jgi:transposase
VLHIMAIVQLRNDTEGRAYYRRKLAAGKTTMEAMRALKRRLSDVVYRKLVDDQKRQRQLAKGTGPGGQAGAATGSSAADSNPNIDASEKSLPGPATTEPTPAAPTIPIRSSARSRRSRTAPTRSRGQAQFA